MMSLWDALRMNMMISYQELVRTFLNISLVNKCVNPDNIKYYDCQKSRNIVSVINSWKDLKYSFKEP